MSSGRAGPLTQIHEQTSYLNESAIGAKLMVARIQGAFKNIGGSLGEKLERLLQVLIRILALFMKYRTGYYKSWTLWELNWLNLLAANVHCNCEHPYRITGRLNGE